MKQKTKRSQVFREFVQTALNQLFGWVSPHEGKLVLTTSAAVKMHDWRLDGASLQDVFRYGTHTDKGDKVQVIRQYHNYSVGLWYKVIYTPAHPNIPSGKQYLVITCWKGERGGNYDL